MIRNYLIVAIRNLLKNRVSTVVNILGLSTGLLCTMLLAFWVLNETSYDKFHSKKNNIYQVLGEVKNNGESFITQYAPSAIAQPLNDQIPEINLYARTFQAGVVISNDNIRFGENGIYADPELFKIFDFPLTEGTAENIFANPNSIVISEQLAEKYFMGESALGKTLGIVFDKMQSYQVTGVLKSLPSNSSLQFDFVMSYDAFETAYRPWWKSTNKASFNNFNVHLYVELIANANVDEVNSKLASFISEYSQNGSSDELFIYPFKDYYLHSDFSEGKIPSGRIKYVKLISVTAFVIFLIACINFINLTTAVAGNRAQEVGMRKTAGATKKQLLYQFLVESILLTTISMVAALTFTEVLTPFYSLLVNKQIEVPFDSWIFILSIVAFTLGTGVIAGIYPSVVLSSFEPIQVLKNSRTTGATLGNLRKALVIIQFSLSIGFIIYTLIAHDQMTFINQKELGLRKENIVFHGLHSISSRKETYQNDLMKIEGVQAVSFSEQDPYHTSNGNSHVTWPGKPEDSDVFFNVIQVGGEFLKTFELDLLSGENFSPQFDAESSHREIIINESATKAMGIQDPVGTEIQVWGYQGTIKGVVKDYHHQSLAYNIEPVLIIYSPNQTWNAFISLKNENISGTLASIREVYSKYEDEYPFDYRFADEQLMANYQDVITTGRLSDIFSVLAIFISCLGLFGLSAFMAEQRKLETGVRKVLGAKEASLFYLFSFDFVKLIFYSFIIAAPLTWYYAEKWLADFAYHTEIGFLPFLLAGGSSLIIAIITISYNLIRATRINPVELLRHP